MSHELSLNVLAAEINAHCDAVEVSMGQTLHLAAKAGDKLNQAKALVAHGEWLDWLGKNCRVKRIQASKYMRLAKEMPELISNVQSSEHLGVDAAMELLSAPEEIQQQVKEKLDAGESVTQNEIRELKRQNELLKKQAETAVDDYKRENESLADQLNHLEVAFEAYKLDEGLRINDKTRELKTALEKEKELADAVREQRDRMIKDSNDRIKALEQGLTQARNELAEKVEQAKAETIEASKHAIDADIAERMNRLAMAEAKIDRARRDLDALEKRHRLTLRSEDALRAIRSHLIGIDTIMADFAEDVDSHAGDQEISNISDWVSMVETYEKGMAELRQFVNRMGNHGSVLHVVNA